MKVRERGRERGREEERGEEEREGKSVNGREGWTGDGGREEESEGRLGRE